MGHLFRTQTLPLIKKKKKTTTLSQSELSNFFMYIIKSVTIGRNIVLLIHNGLALVLLNNNIQNKTF